MVWVLPQSDASGYRELNIMNSVLNKDFISKSYENITLGTFSDVFHLASCMQICSVRDQRNRAFLPRGAGFSLFAKMCISGKGESDEEW